jgi:hypothetical protein
MKSRLTLLVLAAALLIAPLASHAEPLASTAPAACAANASTSQLPGFSTPASDVLLKTIIGPKCGSCSLSPCVGAKVGSICGIGGGGEYKYCGDIGTCPADGLTQCQCKTGPPF